jgi:hypothetical protein
MLENLDSADEAPDLMPVVAIVEVAEPMMGESRGEEQQEQ